MTVEVYRPNHWTLEESQKSMSLFKERVEQMQVSDGDLKQYIEAYFSSFRSTVDEFFPQVAKSLALYAGAPFHTTVVRLGPNGVIIGHRRSDSSRVEVKQVPDFDPPLESTNIFVIAKRLQVEQVSFSATPRTFDLNEAHSDGVGDALSAVLEFFWSSIPDSQTFEVVARQLITAAGLSFTDGVPLKAGDAECKLDAKARILLQEPAGFRRFENWAFEFKHIRLSASDLRQLETHLGVDDTLDCLCIVTSDDLTSISRHVASTNTKVGVWGRSILNGVIENGVDILRSHFDEFPKAVRELSRRLEETVLTNRKKPREQFAKRLTQCPHGQEHFAEYEKIGIDLISFLFGEHLGPPKPQCRTLDEKQRRDVLYRNNRSSRFFDRCFHRFDSDSLIIDFKNYGDEITSTVVTDVDKYANKALGRFILVVSRKGPASSVAATQQRVYRDSNTVVLVLSDDDLLEMVERKDREQLPEDVIEDKLDEFLRSY